MYGSSAKSSAVSERTLDSCPRAASRNSAGTRMVCPTYIGIAGWSYPDWEGIVYTDPKMDQLAYVSRFVDCIGINSTFYRSPVERNARSWLDRTSDKPEFFFTAKLHQSFTHEGRIDAVIVKQFHEGFAPMLEAGKLKHLLVQFRYDFADNAASRQHLTMIVKPFKDAFSIVVELRHKSWEHEDALSFLRDLGVAVCNLDYPVSRQSFNCSTARWARRGTSACTDATRRSGSARPAGTRCTTTSIIRRSLRQSRSGSTA